MVELRERHRGALALAATVLGALAIVLVIVNGFLFLQNQSGQAEVSERQQFINQSAQLGQLNESLIRSIATAAANNNDEKLRDILAQNGVTYTVNPAAPAPSAVPQATAPVATPGVPAGGK
jgi:hypothetical protein